MDCLVQFLIILICFAVLLSYFCLVSILYGGENVPKNGCSCYGLVGWSKHKNSQMPSSRINVLDFISWILIFQVNDPSGC